MTALAGTSAGPLDDARLIDRCFDGIAPFVIAMAGGAPDSRIIESPGGVAMVAPSAPGRSMFNSFVINRDRQQLVAEAIAELEPEYASAGVTNRGIWTIEGDAAEAELLAAGWVIDSCPRAMGAELGELELADPAPEVVERWDMPVVAQLNERAYDLPAGSFGAVIGGIERKAGMFCFIIEQDGQPASTAMSYELPSGDCTFYFVATLPEFQGRGFGSKVMNAALSKARGNGSATATLQASKHGPPLYLKLGLRDLGVAANLWERRHAE